MNANERRIAKLEKEIRALETELYELENTEAVRKSPVKVDDVIEIDHSQRPPLTKVMRRYKVSRITARGISARQIKKDGTLGEEKRIWQNYKKVKP